MGSVYGAKWKCFKRDFTIAAVEYRYRLHKALFGGSEMRPTKW
jgi:hypothetical protein